VNGPSSNGLNHAVSLPFTVVAPNDFTLQPAPAILNLGPGSTASYAILVEGGGGFTGNVNLSVSGIPAGITATICPSAVSPGGEGALTVTTSATPPLGSWPLTVTGVSGSLTHTAQVYATIGGPVPATIIGPVPGAILNGGETVFTSNLGAGVGQYALQVGSTPGGYDYSNLLGSAQYFAQTSDVLGTYVNLPSTNGQTIYATLSSIIGGIPQSQSYTYTIGSTANMTIPSGATLVSPAPTVYNNGVPVDFTYSLSSGSPQLLSPIVQTSDPTLFGQVIAVTPTTAVVQYIATPLAQPGTQDTVHFMTSGDTQAHSAAQSPMTPVSFSSRNLQRTPVLAPRFDKVQYCDPSDFLLYGFCPDCDPNSDPDCIVGTAPPIGGGGGAGGGGGTPPVPAITSVTFSSSTVVSGTTTVAAGSTQTVTIIGTNFSTSGLVEACPSDGSGGPCIQPTTPPTWGAITLSVVFTIPLSAGGHGFCMQVKAAQFAPATASLCNPPALFYVPSPPSVSINLKLLGTTISTDGNYFEDSTIQVTAVNPTFRPGFFASARDLARNVVVPPELITTVEDLEHVPWA